MAKSLSAAIYEDIKGRVQAGLTHNFPVESRLIMLGQISYAATRGEITLKQADELETMLGLELLLPNFEQIREMGFWGDVEPAA